jgi:hypothetical protein
MAYPREITVTFKVYEDGKIEVQGNEGTDLSDALKNGKPIKGHNSIGVLVSNPTCLIVGGRMYCY